ncbi:hypothetical protein J3R82DRAFT_6926 [Butyriboletus roseoflavus]|nr:hypothetical protein J3R82DRAFT_6926 [Butyriboletus roseoflavus]
MTDQQIWQWTLTQEAIAPCFVRDVLAMRQSTDRDADFFWLGYTPCRSVVLVGMVVAIQVYDKRAIYTIDDGTAVIDCVLRHPHSTLPTSAPAPRSPLRSTGGPSAKTNPQRSPPKKPRLEKVKAKSIEPPPPITEPGYPVRVVGRVVRHFQSKQIHADMIDPCPSSLDEITHLERVINLHKTKYSLAVPFVLPPKPTWRAPALDTSTSHADANVFSDTLLSSRPGPSTTYTLPAPPCIPVPLQNRNRPPSLPTHVHSTYHGHTHVPSSPSVSSITSSTPSSPCKPSSPVKAHEAPRKPKLRHPSRLHARDLTANTFRLYVKHYMDNAPPPFRTSWPSPSRSTCEGVTTPTKHARDEGERDEPTPRPYPSARNETRDGEEDEDEDGPTLGFTLSHLRRVPELALLAARVVRIETRKRDKADREKERANAPIPSSTSVSFGKPNGNGSTPTRRTGAMADPPHKKMARLFSWAVVKLYEEGSIVLWDGDVRPLPVPPPPIPLPPLSSGLWNNDVQGSTLGVPSATIADLSTSTCSSTSVLYTSSASASLYSHYHAPRRPPASRHYQQHDEGSERGVDVVDADADPEYLSDPPVDEEAYVPLTARLLAGYVREAVAALRRGGARGCTSVSGRPRRDRGGMEREPTPGDVLACMQRTDGRWARLGVWAVEEALAVLKRG